MGETADIVGRLRAYADHRLPGDIPPGPVQVVNRSELAEAAETITRLTQELQEAREALLECEEFFDQRADADQPSGCDSPIQNEEMSMLIKVRAALSVPMTTER